MPLRKPTLQKRNRKLSMCIMLLALLAVITAFGFSSCDIDDCECDSEIDEVIERNGEADDIDSSLEDGVNTLRLVYQDLGVAYNFEWGNKVDACCNFSTETLDSDESDETDGETDDSAPIAQDQTVTTAVNTPTDITLSATDVDGDDLTFEIQQGPENGTAQFISDNVVRYTPNEDFEGIDEFTFTANDGQQDSNIATVTITVSDDPNEGTDNTAPVAFDQEVTTPTDEDITITMVATDVDGDALTYSIVTPPEKGTLSDITGDEVIYSPSPGESYEETFTFKANDGQLDSNTATVTVTVNSTPVALDKSQTTTTDVAIDIQLDAVDEDGDFLVFDIVDGQEPDHGVLTWTGIDTVTYTPGATFTDKDDFQFTATDTFEATSNAATVTIINSTEAAPVAFSIPMWDANVPVTDMDTPIDITLKAMDDAFSLDPDYEFSWLLVSTETKEGGTLTAPTELETGVEPNASTTYTPPTGFQGWDQFHFRVKNELAHSDLATVYIAVGNVPPVVLNPVQNIIVAADTETDTIKLEAIDPNDDDLEYSIKTIPLMGDLSDTAASGEVTYKSDPGASGTDSFVWEVTETDTDDEYSSTGKVFISIGDTDEEAAEEEPDLPAPLIPGNDTTL